MYVAENCFFFREAMTHVFELITLIWLTTKVSYRNRNGDL